MTESFASLARNEAEALGMPDVDLVQVPHPIAGAKPDEIEAFAEQATAKIIALIGAK